MRIERSEPRKSPSSRLTPRAISRFSIPNSQFREAERGYTLAALLVILTIVAVVISFTVPRMWSDVLKREREIHTIFVMKQYAQAIADYERLKGGLPTKLEQLEKATMPRVLRNTYVNPLSGELDWIMVPQGTVTPSQAQVVPGGGGTGPAGGNPATGTAPTGLQTGTQGRNTPPPPKPRDFSGPFIGVRPPQTGTSIIELNGQSTYENWMYTVNELKAAQAAPTTTQGRP